MVWVYTILEIGCFGCTVWVYMILEMEWLCFLLCNCNVWTFINVRNLNVEFQDFGSMKRSIPVEVQTAKPQKVSMYIYTCICIFLAIEYSNPCPNPDSVLSKRL